MNKQISFLDFIRFFLCFITAFFVYDYIYVWGWSQGEGSGGIGLALLKFFLGIALSAFLAILIGSIFVSWRLKLIAGTLILYAIIAGRIFDLISSLGGFWLLLGSLIRLSFGLLGALGAVFIWKFLTNVRKRKASEPKTRDLKQKKRKPRISFFLLTLSLLSVPATYVAMFVSAFVTIGLSALILLLVFQLPRVPVFIIIASFLAPLVAAWASLKALLAMFFPETQFQTATLLDTTAYPNLNNIINEVCMKVRTKKPTAVILHAEPTFFVMNGKLGTFDGIVKGRILALGMPLIKELTSLEIKSVLAHEFAHFSGRDTLYSTIVSPVYRGITSSMESIGAVSEEHDGSSVSGAMNFLLITSILFLNVFLEYFASIDMILSRNRELRADSIASRIYGKEAFSDSLRKVIRISSDFGVNSTTIAIESGKNFFDLYSKHLQKHEDKLHEYEEKALSEKETEFDSHPSLATRLASLPESQEIDSESSAITLKDDFKKGLTEKEKELAQKYTERVKAFAKLYEQYLKMVEGESVESFEE